MSEFFFDRHSFGPNFTRPYFLFFFFFLNILFNIWLKFGTNIQQESSTEIHILTVNVASREHEATTVFNNLHPCCRKSNTPVLEEFTSNLGSCWK